VSSNNEKDKVAISLAMKCAKEIKGCRRQQGQLLTKKDTGLQHFLSQPGVRKDFALMAQKQPPQYIIAERWINSVADIQIKLMDPRASRVPNNISESRVFSPK
jgi:hypothetical protein